jgi:PAS domain S-box-containing protein
MRGPFRVLLVEADGTTAEAVSRAIGDAAVECEITVCLRGEDALELLEDPDATFGLLLTGQRLPGISGLELCEEARRKACSCELVLLADGGNEELAVRALRAGVDDYVFRDEAEEHLGRVPDAVNRAAKRYRDNRDRVRSDALLRESERRYREMYDTASEMYFTIARDGTVLAANFYAASALGYERSELIGGSVWQLIHPNDRERVQGVIEEIFTSGNDQNHLDFRKVRKDGSVMVVRERVRLWQGAEEGSPEMHIICRDRTEHPPEDMVLASRERLRNLAARLHAVREEERTMIAREIHDELGQAMTGVKMDLSWIIDRLPPASSAELGERAQATLELLDNTMNSIRQISTRLRPAMLDDLGLSAAIEWQTQEFETRTGIECALRLSVARDAIDQDRATAVFRIFQEALTNVARHAEAQHVEIALRLEGSQLLLDVRDDGKGVLQEQLSSPRSLGVVGMRERAGALGGRVTVKPGEPTGTCVSLRMAREVQNGFGATPMPAPVSCR